MQQRIRGRTGLSMLLLMVVLTTPLLLVSDDTLHAQFLQVIPISEGSVSFSDPVIFVDDNCPGCVPQQVSICVRDQDEIYFTGSLLDFQSLFPVLASPGDVLSPALAQGTVASYYISFEQQITNNPRSIFLIESIASGFGEPVLISAGTNDAFDSSIVVLNNGERVISWTRSVSTSNEIMMKYADQTPVSCGVGENSGVFLISAGTALVIWQDGTKLMSLIADSSSQGAVVDLYDMLDPIDQWDAVVHPDGSIDIVVETSDQIQLLRGTLAGGIISQEVIRAVGGAISELAISAQSSDRYTIAWIQDQMGHRYAVDEGLPPVSEDLDWVPGIHSELDLSFDAIGNEHYVVVTDEMVFYTHNTPAPEADFSIFIENDTAADRTISFEDQTVGMVETRLWDFGDGNTSNDVSGEHAYLEPGSYTLSLTVDGPGGSDSQTFPNEIVVTTPENAMELADIDVFSGQPVIHPVLGTHADPLQGFQVSVQYDESIIDLQEISIANTQAQSLLPEFIISQINQSGAESYMFLAVIFDTLPPFDGRTMTAGANQTLCTLNYLVVPGTPLGTVTELRFKDGLGDPPINNIYAIEGGFAVTPYFIHGMVTISQQPQFLFIRGDATYDQSVNIADAIFLLEYLFSGGVFTVCPDAADTNDDGTINIGDAINLLNYLFAGGETIPYPYPGYGLDPTQDSLGDCLP